MNISIVVALFLSVLGEVQSFVQPSSKIITSDTTRTPNTVSFLSDIPQDEVEKKKNKPPKQSKEEPWIQRKKDKMDWRPELPEAPQDQLTLSGDIASLFLYAFIDHFLNDVYLKSVLDSSTSAADAASSLDPSGTSLVLASTPVWLDATNMSPELTEHILMTDLQAKVLPHFAPVLSTMGTASVFLATSWLVAGIFHKAFHYQNTIECNTHRAVTVTGQTWLTAATLMVLVATASHHAAAGETTVQDVSLLMMNGRIPSPMEQWFSVLTRADAEYIASSLGVVLTWRFLISYLLGGWNKK